MKAVRERFSLILEAEPRDGITVEQLLRAFLKQALRGWGLRAVEIREIKERIDVVETGCEMKAG